MASKKFSAILICVIASVLIGCSSNPTAPNDADGSRGPEPTIETVADHASSRDAMGEASE